MAAAGFGLCQEAKELAAGGVEGSLLGFGLAMGEQRPAVVADEFEDDLLDRPPAETAVHLQSADDLTAKHPDVVVMPAQGLARQRPGQLSTPEKRCIGVPGLKCITWWVSRSSSAPVNRSDSTLS